MDDELIEEYRQAYREANPDKPEIDVQYQHGWYYVLFTDNPAKGLSTPYRKRTLVEMRDRLRDRNSRFGMG